MSDQKEQGFIKKTITFLIPTQVGDHWMNQDEYDFDETRQGWVIVKEKGE